MHSDSLLNLPFAVSDTANPGLVRPSKRRRRNTRKAQGETLAAIVAAQPPLSASPAWELSSTLHHHFHPAVAGVARHTTRRDDRTAQLVIAGAPVPLAHPKALLSRFDAADGGFNPPVAVPKRHPWADMPGRGASVGRACCVAQGLPSMNLCDDCGRADVHGSWEPTANQALMIIFLMCRLYQLHPSPRIMLR